MQLKEIVRLLIVLGVFFLLIPYLFKLFKTPIIDVVYSTPVSGEVTGSYMNRQYYVHYLNHNTKMYYDFNRFLSASPLPAGLSQEEINRQSLGHYLRKGDLITKAVNDTILSVRRGSGTTQWVCSSKQIDN